MLFKQMTHGQAVCFTMIYCLAFIETSYECRSSTKLGYDDDGNNDDNGRVDDEIPFGLRPGDFNGLRRTLSDWPVSESTLSQSNRDKSLRN